MNIMRDFTINVYGGGVVWWDGRVMMVRWSMLDVFIGKTIYAMNKRKMYRIFHFQYFLSVFHFKSFSSKLYVHWIIVIHILYFYFIFIYDFALCAKGKSAYASLFPLDFSFIFIFINIRVARRRHELYIIIIIIIMSCSSFVRVVSIKHVHVRSYTLVYKRASPSILYSYIHIEKRIIHII